MRLIAIIVADIDIWTIRYRVNYQVKLALDARRRQKGMRACRALVSPGGGTRTIVMAVCAYRTGRDWSPQGIVFVNGKSTPSDSWTIRPTECQEFVGAIAFRDTPSGGELVAFRSVNGSYHSLCALVTLDRAEAVFVHMSGGTILEWALPLIRRVTKVMPRNLTTT
jgi:hypothetical protein